MSSPIKQVLIIDDANDAIPCAADLVGADWDTFFDDLGEHRAAIEKAFPDFEAQKGQVLAQSNEFVASLWKIVDELPQDLSNLVFGSYRTHLETDRNYLDQLEARLKSIGVEVRRGGRSVDTQSVVEDLIFVDLYLGVAQDEDSIGQTIGLAKGLVEARKSSPPSIVLMSRSSLLADRADDFRDRAGMLGALFRFCQKARLLEEGALLNVIARAGATRNDGVRLSEFLLAWDEGLRSASERFLRHVRRLDLPDYAQITDLLLAHEGQPLGSYLLDVFETVLQYEIEGDAAISAAANALEGIDARRYPAPHAFGSAELQELVFRTLCHNPSRLKIKTTRGNSPVSFGDILVECGKGIPRAADESGAPAPRNAFAVLTPACDLVRSDGAEQVLLVQGRLGNLVPGVWKYKGKTTTPVCIPGQEGVSSIQWNLKHVRTISPAELAEMLMPGGQFARVGRLRQPHALELQQQLLADIGRVGIVARMPATFVVYLEFRIAGNDAKYAKLAAAQWSASSSTAYVGRDGEGGQSLRLVLSDDQIDEVAAALNKLSDDGVHKKVVNVLRFLKTNGVYHSLSSGIQLNEVKGSVKQIRDDRPSGGLLGQDGRIGGAVWIGSNDVELDSENAKHGLFLLVLRDPSDANARAAI